MRRGRPSSEGSAEATCCRLALSVTALRRINVSMSFDLQVNGYHITRGKTRFLGLYAHHEIRS